jgi:excinuclease ABC subunit C
MKVTEFDATALLATLPGKPGVYQMFAGDGSLLYVGKAKNLRNRVRSYFSGRPQTARIQALVSRVASIEVTVTRTEAEALILEHNLIKQQAPFYNILLKDDKSYPYILVTEEDWPRVALHRGPRRAKGQYFGPYPNSQAAREALFLLQKVFNVRQCEDSFFRNRSRPCLQYQIKRCSGPCVGLVESSDYARDVERTQRFLRGENEELMQGLMRDMEEAANSRQYERAASYRDSIAQLRSIQAEQVIEVGGGNIDIVAAAREGSAACVHMIFVRQGRIIGSRSYFPRDELASDASDLIADFVPHYYLSGMDRTPPAEILVAELPPNPGIIESALQQISRRRIRIRVPRRGRKRDWLSLAERTAQQNLSGRLASQLNQRMRMEALGSALGLDRPPGRIECFDISHHAGTQTVASCVVFTPEGPLKSDYRQFNIEGITGGDDYAAMRQVLERRYRRQQASESACPDLIIVDGGKGQLSQAVQILENLGLQQVVLIGVAKGATRKSGWERLFVGADAVELQLDSHSPAFHLIQSIRDEAHRFAVAGHTARKKKQATSSRLDQISGIGAKRKKALLQHFGGLQGIASASVNDLIKVEGISSRLAADIYAHFHD